MQSVQPRSAQQFTPAHKSANLVFAWFVHFYTACGVVAAFLTVFFVVFHRTQIGQVIQAVYQSERGAALVGINVRAFHSVMWGVGAAMAAIAGVLLAPITLLYPDLGANFLIRGFAAMTLGGFGSLWGAIAGGLIIGLVEVISIGYFGADFVDIAVYGLLLLILFIRPTGLLAGSLSGQARV